MPAGEEVTGAGPDPARLVHESETIIPGPDANMGGLDHAADDSPRPRESRSSMSSRAHSSRSG